jgi:hypothetical protein
VSEPFASEVANFCKQNNKTISDVMQDSFKSVRGGVSPSEVPIDTSIQDTILGIGGGSVVGILAYKGIKSVLANRGYTEDDIEMYSAIAGIVCALVTVLGIKELIKKS